MTIELKNIKLIKKIASGGFGEIYLGHDVELMIPVAVKVEKRSQHGLIKHEYNVYCKLRGKGTFLNREILSREIRKENTPSDTALNGEFKMEKYENSSFLPSIYDYGKILVENVYLSCFVMELLGKSLEELFVDCGKKFSIKTTCMLGLRMVENIEMVHNRHYIHRDIKPDNFVFNIAQDKLYLIDFGLAKEYRDPVTLIHKEIVYDKSLTGTARYASIRTHQGYEQSRRDDLESIGYCLVYFLKGRLPWQGLRAETKQDRYDRIKECKENMKLWELCADLPHEFYMYLFYVRNLEYDDWPNYEYLKDLFRSLMKKHRWRDDDKYDWKR